MKLSLLVIFCCTTLVLASSDQVAKIRMQLMQDIRKGKPSPNLNEDEIKERLKEMMVKFDEDNDEKISREELRTWILQADKVIPQRMMKEQFELSDTNEDGFVTWAEHLKSTFDVDDPENIKLSLEGTYDHKKRTLSKIQEDEKLFKGADRNGDEKLDKEEFPSLSIPEYDSEMSQIVIRHAIGDRDADGDGQLTLEEYLEPSDSYHYDSDPARARVMFERVIDVNGDGILDYNELKRFYIPNNPDGALKEEQHLMEHVDEDGDDHLSFDEVMDLHHIFMKSDITSYGHHIHEFHNIRDEL